MENEMKYLYYLENDNRIKAIINRVQKIYGLLTLPEIQFNRLVNLDRLSLQERVFLDLVCDKLNIKIEDYVESSMIFEVNDDVYKIFYLHNIEIDSVPYNFVAYSPVKDKDINIHLKIIGKNKTTDDQIVQTIIMETYTLLSNYLGFNISDALYSGRNITRRYIDYFIIFFRIIDGIFDLKFADYSKFVDVFSWNGMKLNEHEWIYNIYRYAISTDSTYKDYEELIIETIAEEEFANFDNWFSAMSGIKEEKDV